MNAVTDTPVTEMPAPFVFTDAAADKVKQLIEEEGNADLKLRVFVQGGGCSGFQYGFTFDEAVNEDDTVMNKSGVQLLIDSMSYQYLVGAEIDYKDDINGAQFVIKNPNATTTCGCGSSFSVCWPVRRQVVKENGASAPFFIVCAKTQAPSSARVDRPQHALGSGAGDGRQIARQPCYAAHREPCKRQRLDLARRYAKRVGCHHGHAAYAAVLQRLLQRFQNLRIARTAATDIHRLGVRCMPFDFARNRHCGQRDQCGLYVSGGEGSERLELCIQPLRVEQVAAGAFRRLLREKGFVEQRVQQRAIDLSARGEMAVFVERLAEMALRPFVE